MDSRKWERSRLLVSNPPSFVTSPFIHVYVCVLKAYRCIITYINVYTHTQRHDLCATTWLWFYCYGKQSPPTLRERAHTELKVRPNTDQWLTPHLTQPTSQSSEAFISQ